jgi:hypothetical protein
MSKLPKKVGVGQLTLTLSPSKGPKDEARETQANGSAASGTPSPVRGKPERKRSWHSSGARTKRERPLLLAHEVPEEELGLSLHPEKTRVVSVEAGFEFLGYHYFGDPTYQAGQLAASARKG